MGKDIDWEGLEKEMNDPSKFYQGDEAGARLDATMKKMLGQTGPAIKVVDTPGGGFRLDIDLDTIVPRGSDRE